MYYNPAPGDSGLEKELETCAHLLREECRFFAVRSQDLSPFLRTVQIPSIIFKPHGYKLEESRSFHQTGTEPLCPWVKEQCLPLVKVLDYQSSEEILNNFLPLLVLIHHPEDRENVQLFRRQAEKELTPYAEDMEFAVGDVTYFSHPLVHLGKTKKDLPLIVLDTMEHLFVFPDFAALRLPGALGTYVKAFLSGELHSRYHEGTMGEIFKDLKGSDSLVPMNQDPTAAPFSVFIRLGPSSSRYSFSQHDEF